MNIYGSLMDIFDEKKQKSFMTKKKRHLCRKKREHKQKSYMLL